MKSLYITILLSLATFFISCGETTKKSPIIDIKAIVIDNKNISLYPTDSNLSNTATIKYQNNSIASGTDEMTWSSSNNNVLNASQGKISILTNRGGDVNLSIKYKQFSDYTPIHVYKLTSFNLLYPDVNSSGTGTYTFSAKGSFDNNVTDKSIKTNIIWVANNGATISALDGVATITFITGETNVTATMFGDTNSSSLIAPQTINFNIN